VADVDAMVVDESVVVAALPGQVWHALVDSGERARWWPDLEFTPVAASPLAERWTDEDGTEQLTRGTVVGLEDGRRLQLRWADADWPASTDIELRLEAAGAGTRVTVRESGWERLPRGRALAGEHAAGWRMHLAQLRDHVAR
jgi:uncharacterized protein YndB with AHSA1/START domain